MAGEAAPPPPSTNLAPPSERGNIPGESSEQHADAFGEAFTDLDKAFGVAPGESPPAKIPPERPAPAKPPEAPKPAAAKPAPKPGEPQRGPDGKFLPVKEPAKPGEQPKPEEKPAEPPIEKMAPAELRKAYEGLRRKLSALEEERKKPAEAAPIEPQEDPEKLQLTERLTEREKRLQALEEELQYTAYEKSQEYKEKYEQPFISAWKMGQDRAARLKVAEQKDALDEVIQPARQGTAEDFNTLMQIQDDDEAAEWAHKLFGPAKASSVLYHRERVQEANFAKHKALEDYKTNGVEREKQRQVMLENQTKAIRTLYQKTMAAAIDKYPQFFKPLDDDPKTKALLAKGMRLADRALGDMSLLEGEKPMSGEERIKLQAAMRNCFGSFQNLTYQLQKERTLRTDLEKKLADFEASVPRGGDGRGAGQPGAGRGDDSDTPESAFDAAFGT